MFLLNSAASLPDYTAPHPRLCNLSIHCHENLKFHNTKNHEEGCNVYIFIDWQQRRHNGRISHVP